MRMRFILNLLFLNMRLVYKFRIRIGEVILFVLRFPYLLEKGGGIYYLDRKIMKVLGSNGVHMEEFLDNISKLKRMYYYALPWKLRNLPLISR